MNLLFKCISIVCIILLQACSNGTSPFIDGSSNSDTRIGSGTGGDFEDGAIGISVNPLIEGGSTLLTVNIVDSEGSLINTLGSVTFSSICVSQSQASLTATTVELTAGTASTTYNDINCTGTDNITALATLDSGVELSASSNLNIVTVTKIGNGTGNAFQEGVISIPTANVTPAGRTDLSVNIVDGNNVLSTNQATISFTSTCSTANPSTASFTRSTVVTASGLAATTYIDEGCIGTDFITATLSIGLVDQQATGEITISPLRIGSNDGTGFVDGVVALGLSSLPTGGTTSVTINVVDTGGTLITNPILVNFTSNCVAQGIASFDNDSASTVNGVASVTFTAGSGCIGDDTIRATINPFGNNETSAQATVSVAAPGAGSIQYDSSSNDIIALKGAGTTAVPENSTIIFKVLDNGGNPISGQDITFQLTNESAGTSLGGTSLLSTTDTSDSNGDVQATIQSGTSATSVRVIATLTSTISDPTPISTQSQPVALARGFPSVMSIAFSEHNPRAWNYVSSGASNSFAAVDVTVTLKDHFSNPPPDGTVVQFRTELGVIDASCVTGNPVAGICTVQWRSQGREGTRLNAGRSTIFASVLGEEPYIENSNVDGVYEVGDSFTDLPEALHDTDESGAYTIGEFYIDENTNTAYDAVGDTKYNGRNCIHPTDCDTTLKSINLSATQDMVLSEINPVIVKITNRTTNTVLCDNTNTVSADDCYNFTGAATTDFHNGVLVPTTTATTYPPSISLASGAQSIAFAIVGIENRQVLPISTVIDFGLTGNGNIASGAKQTIPNTSINAALFLSAVEYTVTVEPDTSPSNDGSLTIKVTPPSEIAVEFPSIPINDSGYVLITAPANNATVPNGGTSSTTFSGTAIDPQDGDISASIVWTSNVNGTLGTGASISTAALVTAGTHTITATSFDNEGTPNETSTAILITVNP